jgi:hypothetical protein
MVPHATTIPIGNVVVNQAPIGTPLSSRPIPPLPHGYHVMNTFIPFPTQVRSRVSRVFIPPGYNVVAGFILTPSQVLSQGSYLDFIGGSDPSGSNQIGGTTQSFTYGYHIPFGGKYNPRGKPQFGSQT